MPHPVVLLVEDDPDDEKLTLLALEDARVVNDVVVVRDGPEALDFLFRRGAHAARPDLPPSLVLLDLKLPKMSGLDVLEHARKEASLDVVPIVVFTSSSHDEEIRRAYELGANSYVRKPVEFDDFARAVRDVGLYWLITNRLPER